MELVVALLVVAFVVVGVMYSRQRAEQERRQRRESLERFLAELRRSGTDQAGSGPEPWTASTVVERGDQLVVPASGRAPVPITPPADLPTFDDVGGMDALKQELSESLGLILEHPERAEEYGIRWNGVLLHGPPGTGKSHIVRALAGEFGASLLHLSTGDLVSGVVGESAGNVAAAFRAAAANRPCVLFFDEFDSIAQRREAGVHQEERRTVNQLLQSLEEHRDLHDLIVVAATNDLGHLDPAVIRAGRFDRHIRVDLPDRAARRAILAVQLAGRPHEQVALDELADRTDGRSAADLRAIVDTAALAAFREATDSGDTVHVTQRHLHEAIAVSGGTDRPTVEDWSWERLVLPTEVEEELRQLERLLVEPELARELGIEPPRGVLLAGPPGTGKTSIAKVLAATAQCSFYPVSAADVTSKWVGESEGAVKRLFERARSNRPSIVFIDEIDAIGRDRDAGDGAAGERLLTQLLAEIDGLGSRAGVLVIGATNRPDALDPALVRGGRLSRRIELPLPGVEERWEMLEQMTARMPTVGVDLYGLAIMTDGMSGADLQALCHQAGIEALVRTRQEGDPDAAREVTVVDFQRALDRADDH